MELVLFVLATVELAALVEEVLPYKMELTSFFKSSHLPCTFGDGE